MSDPKSPFDQSYNSIHSDSSRRVFSDDSFRTVQSFDHSDPHIDTSSNLPTPNLSVSEARFGSGGSSGPTSSGPTSPVPGATSAARKPSLRFKLPSSSITDNAKHTGNQNGNNVNNVNQANDNTISENEMYSFKQPMSPFNDKFEFADNIYTHDNDVGETAGMKRNRWGTTRNKQGKPKKENVSRSKTLKGILRPQGVMRTFSTRNNSRSNSRSTSRRNSIGNTASAIIGAYESDPDEPEEPRDPKDQKEQLRSIVVNQSLPEQYLDEQGLPTPLYPRNKIRTTKYTPLSFLPKNITFQFIKNVANIYFLAMIILGFFSIFGVPSPILSAVPLIVIVILTAIRDAIEDSRRTVSDLEVNNQLTHILTDLQTNPNYSYENRNIGVEKVSLWRKFKKLNSRLLFQIIGASKRTFTKKGRAQKVRERSGDANPRKSIDTDIVSPKNSMALDENPFRKSGQYKQRSLKFERNYWKNVKVGDIIRIHNNEEIPADVLILSSSEDDNGCYVETKNLDGETNLKVRQGLKYSHDHKIKNADDIMNTQFQINSEGPHPNLYSYQGNLQYLDPNGDPREETITINNLLLRGCSLRNTKWVIGIVIFTGSDSKIMLNAGITPTKQSRLSRELNYYVILNFVLLFVVCFVSGIVNGFYYRQTGVSRDYYEIGSVTQSPALNGLISFFVALILYQSLVPISLYITIEIIKSAQAFFIFQDVGMYYERLDFPCNPRSWNISDDLGQIEYVFSDKTGTLTQNLMEFKKCTINGISYGRAYTEALAGLRKRQGFDVETEAVAERELISKDKLLMFDGLQGIHPNNQYIDDLSFISSEFVEDLKGSKGNLQQKSNEHFMLALALCHSVLIEDDDKNPGKKLLKAQSPDEAALVGTARSLGFEFCGSTKQGLLVNIQGETKEYQILNILEFNSTRKRMSCLIKIPGKTPNDEPKVLLICKGADSIIYGRLSKTENDKALLETTSSHLEQFATEGLRTLCLAQREISWSQYSEWSKRHNEAASSLENREDKMESVADSIERELILLGGTAIEDRLQDGVPDSISILAKAGIKLWVLTGDKVETAINIGFSCNLLGNDMELLIIKTDLTKEESAKYSVTAGSPVKIVEQLISNYLDIFFGMKGDFDELEAAKGDHSPPNEKFGVIIDGDALKLVLNDKTIKNKFLLLCKNCKAVLCCRVSPAQKAGVVKLVKDTLDVMTLAIGDGSNDVAMIQAADIGVGIAGEEGRQAAMSSDYAIGQFRFLTKLLLTHGRWSYKRFCEMIPLFFYKNTIYSIAMFWYGVYSDFDGAYLFEFTYTMFYNLAFTSLPIIFLGVFDQDVSAKVSLLVPELYRSGITRTEFPQKKFWLYLADGIYQSAVSFFMPYLLYRIGFTGMNGLPIDHRYWVGIAGTTIAVVSCNLYFLLHQYRWDWLSSLIIAISIIILYFWTGVWTCTTYSEEFYEAGRQIFGNVSYWGVTFIGILVCLIPRFFYDMMIKLYTPHDSDIIRECVQRGDFDGYPENYDPTDPNKPKISNYTVGTLKSLNEQDQEFSKDEAVERNFNGSSTTDSLSEVNENHLVNERKIKNLFKRQSKGKSWDTQGILGFYNRNNTNDELVKTEEIALEEFDNNRQRISRISSDNKRYSTDRGFGKIRTSLDLPELTTVDSLTRQVSRH